MIKIVIGTMVLLYSFQVSYTQTAYEYRKPITEKSVPKLVLEAFKEQYPGVLVNNWYATHITYWQNDVSSGWYNDWYGQRQVTIYTYEKVNHYEVEFNGEIGELSRSVYNKYGYWYETRTKMRGLPAELKASLDASKYADWKKSSFVERIETNGWPDSVYRFKLSKGIRGRVIRMNHKGEIVQNKEVSEY